MGLLQLLWKCEVGSSSPEEIPALPSGGSEGASTPQAALRPSSSRAGSLLAAWLLKHLRQKPARKSDASELTASSFASAIRNSYMNSL